MTFGIFMQAIDVELLLLVVNTMQNCHSVLAL
jgi:hypothetical protein